MAATTLRGGKARMTSTSLDPAAPTLTPPTASTTAPPTPATYGVGARITLCPMTDRYVDVILGALADVTPDAAVEDVLTTSTSPVSTYIGGGEHAVVRRLVDLVTAAARCADGAHLSAHILLSRGCPGEVACELHSGPWASTDTLAVPDAGVRAWAEWSLYPLLDGAGGGEHIAPIMAAIDEAKASGLFHSADHYVTRLAGDVGAILALVGGAWLRTGAVVQHVTTHLTLSINSPTEVPK